MTEQNRLEMLKFADQKSSTQNEINNYKSLCKSIFSNSSKNIHLVHSKNISTGFEKSVSIDKRRIRNHYMLDESSIFDKPQKDKEYWYSMFK